MRSGHDLDRIPGWDLVCDFSWSRLLKRTDRQKSSFIQIMIIGLTLSVVYISKSNIFWVLKELDYQIRYKHISLSYYRLADVKVSRTNVELNVKVQMFHRLSLCQVCQETLEQILTKFVQSTIKGKGRPNTFFTPIGHGFVQQS